MNRKTTKKERWASLSVLASAALVASSGSAEAAIIYHPFPSRGPVTLPGNHRISQFGIGTSTPNYQSASVSVSVRGKDFLEQHVFSSNFRTMGTGLRGVGFRTIPAQYFPRGGEPFIAAFKKGQTFNQAGGGIGSGLLAWEFSRHKYVVNRGPLVARSFGSSLSRKSSNARGFGSRGYRQKVSTRVAIYSYSSVKLGVARFYSSNTKYELAGYGKQYALFRFDVGPQTDYGWLEMNLSYSRDSGPLLQLIAYAYDTSGKPIAAGAIPEPGHLPLAIGAFALGAIGLREWRARRKAA